MSGSTDFLGFLRGGLPQWLGGTQGLINQAIPAGTDLGAALGAMNPGQAGMAAVPNEAFNQTQPFDVSGVTAPGGGASSAGLSKALGDLGKSTTAAAQGATPPRAGAPQLGQAPLGQPRSAVSLTPLLQLLAQRREALMNSATGGVGAGQANPQGGQRVQGLLGF